MSLSFEGRAVVVTGAGSGIGRAEAIALARRGGSVVVNDIAAANADAVVAEIEADGGTAIASHQSVASAEGGQAIVDSAVEAFGRLDALINNAGVLRTGYFEDLSFEAIDLIIDTHLRAAYFVTQPAWRVMKEQGYGRILMTGSSSGMLSHQGLAAYAGAKAGIYGLTKALAYEGREFGIKVNCLLPWADTAMNAAAPIPGMLDERRKYYDDDLAAGLQDRRDPSLMADIALYLLSEDCICSGEAFSACHGRYARMFVGVARGWLAADPADVSPEAIAEHIDEIRDVTGADVPMWVFDEAGEVARRVDLLARK